MGAIPVDDPVNLPSPRTSRAGPQGALARGREEGGVWGWGRARACVVCVCVCVCVCVEEGKKVDQ